MELTPEEGRVLGALVEKELTTPQGYPLTDNALLAACNQTTSRDPVVAYDLTTVRLAVRSLREQGQLRTVHRPGERSEKHRHELPAALDLSQEQIAILAVLLLRGPQTAAEVRARTERMHPFSAVEQVERVLGELAARPEPLAVRLVRQPGRKEPRWAQLLAAGGTAGAAAAPVARPAHDADAPPPDAVADALMQSLVSALRRRDVESALGHFADDAVLLGAATDQRALGRTELEAFLQRELSEPEIVGWVWDEVTAWRSGSVVWFVLDAQAGAEPCRLSGVVLEEDGEAVLAQLHSSRPVR